MNTPSIDMMGAHAILFCRIAVASVTEDEANVRGMEPGEDVEWKEGCLDLTLDPPTGWHENVHDDRFVVVDFSSGCREVLDVNVEEFTTLWLSFLQQHSKRWIQRN